MFEDLEKLVHQKTEYDSLLKKEGEKAVHKALKDLFDRYPDILAIRWDQYTPYFNDGDACIFHVHDLEAKLAGPSRKICSKCKDINHAPNAEFCSLCGCQLSIMSESGLYTDSDGFIEGYTLKRTGHKAGEDFHNLQNLLRDMESTLQSVFGDHARITCTRNGLEIEEYEHD